VRTLAKVSWKSPSNIAFIKYWGKTGNQLPANPSLSLTLEKCYTITTITVQPLSTTKETVSFDFLFHGEENKLFSTRIEKYLNSLTSILPVLSQFHFKIESENSFPHSAGIASSASAMSALALCLVSIEDRLGIKFKGDLYQRASEIARMGSGSAARSVFGEFATWGKIESVSGTSDNYASLLEFTPHANYKCLRDTILIVDDGTKRVSSSVGHSLMKNHPYAIARFADARQNLEKLLIAMRHENFSDFAQILESEALSLHAMMMTASPWYTLLAPNTIPIIQRIRDFRNETGTKITFTLDAGPNVHVIYPAEDDEKAKIFIQTELMKFTKVNSFILDNIGLGPELLVDEFK
jgi:diphosphomevalonate decarboxylase